VLELRFGPGRFPPSCKYRGRFISFLCKLTRTIDVESLFDMHRVHARVRPQSQGCGAECSTSTCIGSSIGHGRSGSLTILYVIDMQYAITPMDSPRGA
jgi:hypothetical protein